MESSYEDPLDVRRILIAFGYQSLLTRRAQKELERCGRTVLLVRAPIKETISGDGRVGVYCSSIPTAGLLRMRMDDAHCGDGCCDLHPRPIRLFNQHSEDGYHDLDLECSGPLS